jgi:dihydroxyacetone kinase DhaKLM complex PTS-EIIA-like component DhaM
VTQRSSVVAMALVVASCGIDQGGYHPPDVISSQAAQTVVVSGPIDAFGSVHVNGLALDTSRAQVRIDGRAASEADLRLGQMIRAVARVEGATAAAISIDYEENVVGPVAFVDAAAGEFTVLGQRVRATAATRFNGGRLGRVGDLRVGDRVAVSGIALPGNTVLATYVGRAAATEPFEVTAVVTAVGPAATTFELGALTIDYSRAAVLELPAGQPTAATVVEVTGSVLDDGVLVAEYVRALPLLPGTFTAAATALTNAELPAASLTSSSAPSAARFVGVITANNADALAVGDLDVSLTPATVVVGSPANLVAGARVMVAGQILALGRIEAMRIEIQ